MDIDTFYKTLAYACLYKSYGKTVDAIKAEDITISIVREAKPTGLFRYFREHGCEIVEFSRGIYYIEGKAWFPAQIVVTDELDRASHLRPAIIKNITCQKRKQKSICECLRARIKGKD